MSSICGVLDKKTGNVPVDVLNKMIGAMDFGFGYQSDIFCHENTGFACLFNNPFDTDRKDYKIYKDNNLVVLADARLDNRKELADLLKIAVDSSTEQIIALAYIKWEEHITEHLTGDFSIVIWDQTRQHLVCFRDHFGVRPLYYINNNKVFAFASDINALLKSGLCTKEIQEEYIAKTIATMLADEKETLYKNIFRLIPAHVLIINKEKEFLKKYWDIDIKSQTTFSNENEYYKSFLEKLNIAVQCRTNTEMNIAAELSGGIDSSVINALAFQAINKVDNRFFSISHTMPDSNLEKIFPFKDERYYSNLLCEYAGIKNHLYAKAEDKGLLDTLKDFTAIYGGLFLHRLPMFSDSLYEKAQENKCRVLLSGFGGDEMVTYSGAGYKEELMHQWKFRKLLSELDGSKGRSKFRKFLSLALKEFLPFIYKSFRPDNQWAIDRYKELLIDESFSQRMEIYEKYHEEVGFPMDKSMKARQYKRLMHPHVQGRLEDSCIAARRYNLEYVYPLLDVKLIEHYFSFPNEIKYKNNTGRYTMRKAVENVIPFEIQWRQDKTGATVPTVYQRILKDKNQLEKLITESQNVDQSVYLNYNKTLEYHHRIIKQGTHHGLIANPGVYINAIAVMVYQKMIRERKI